MGGPKDPVKRKEYQQKWYREHMEQQRAEALYRRTQHLPEKQAEIKATQHARYLKNRKLYCDRQAERIAVKRRVIVEAYGSKCVCCGEKETNFLELDHVHNDGAAHRRQLGKQTNLFYDWLIKNKFPASIQLLCANCNQGKRRNKGICPHQLNRQIATLKEVQAVVDYETSFEAEADLGDLADGGWGQKD